MKKNNEDIFRKLLESKTMEYGKRNMPYNDDEDKEGVQEYFNDIGFPERFQLPNQEKISKNRPSKERFSKIRQMFKDE